MTKHIITESEHNKDLVDLVAFIRSVKTGKDAKTKVTFEGRGLYTILYYHACAGGDYLVTYSNGWSAEPGGFLCADWGFMSKQDIINNAINCI